MKVKLDFCRTLVLALISFSGCTSTFSQVVLNLQLPPLGLTVKSQLWNFSLINTVQDMEVQVQVNITKAGTNDRILSGASQRFILPRGIKQIKSSDIIPTYNIFNSSYNVDASPNGFLPIGNFNICYSVIRHSNLLDYVETVGDECEIVEIEPLGPPTLTAPGDEENITTNRPLFIWLPPSPVSLFSNLSFALKLVVIEGLQTSSQAIQDNMPVIFQEGITNTSFQYPISSPLLDTAKTYAWQISALSNNNPISLSEVWSFKLAQTNDSTAQRKRTPFYVRLKRENDASYAVCTDFINYHYLNEINDTTAVVQLIDITSASRQSILIPTMVKLQFGENYIIQDLRQFPKIVADHMYLLVLTNSKSEKWYSKFLYKRSN